MLGNLFAYIVFKWTRMRLITEMPPGSDRCVIICAPHTSNVDFFIALAFFIKLRIPIRYTIKREWVDKPIIGAILRKTGALPIDRRPKTPGAARPKMTEVMANLFSEHQRMALLVTPEGTRNKVTQWKSGFYYTALQAQVPIALAFADYRTRTCGVTSMVHPTGNMEQDMREIMAFYQYKVGKFPEQFDLDHRYATEAQLAVVERMRTAPATLVVEGD